MKKHNSVFGQCPYCNKMVEIDDHGDDCPICGNYIERRQFTAKKKTSLKSFEPRIAKGAA